MSFLGDTPVIKIRYRLDGRESFIYAKMEFLNPSGSVKDRIARYIMDRAQERGELKPGQPIVEVTSGNTGIAFSAIGARRGHPVHIFMPSWASDERKNLMRMYGATLHEVTREEHGFKGAFVQADKLAAEIGAYMPHQFENEDNINAHRFGTGAEIIKQIPDVTDFVSGFGTGGTIIGIGKALKEYNPDIRVTALEPDALPLLSGGEIRGDGSHKIEGIGDDFIPEIIQNNRSVIDDIVQINDDDAVCMAAMIARNLGIGVGISSGANFLASVMKDAPEHKVVTVFADDNKKYLTTSLANPQPAPYMLSSRIELIDG